MNKKTHLILLASMFLMLQCTRQQKREPKRRQVEKVKIQDKDFERFVSNFQPHLLPFDGSFQNNELKEADRFNGSDLNWTSVGGIAVQVARKYLFHGRDTLISKKSGGIFQCFYRYRFPSNGKYILLLYYRYSSVTSYDLRLASFDLKGKMIDDLGLGGCINTHGSFDFDYQRDFRINEDHTIQIDEIEIDEIKIDNALQFNEDSSGNIYYLLDKKRLNYVVDKNGKFVYKNEVKTKNVRYYYDTINYQFSPPNSIFTWD
jgi:hypothetical protein